ncbi:S8/S53 family peptidase [Actinocrinis puniceicyclus]|uniref:S8/S53 family peptidase n=1 Tax=Actinocrinis puniceicyclus TaxID=977794 RepID=A0A8J8BBU7_9ACTN|nr:S53 family peptidase [Actinocrinis puniceicyclus]MBS2964432.1 S8/S53 family peptidase [Actinocrinis puniceicyclus]
MSLAVGAAQVALAAPGHAAAPVRVAVGGAPTVPHSAKAAAAPADSTKLSIDIELKTPTSAQLPALAAALNDPKSPNYHHFLAKGQIAQQFGASAAEVAAVDAALKAAGLTPGPVSADGLFVPVTATVGQAKNAFGTGFAGYRYAGRAVYANTSAPKFDAAVSADIAGVVGLDNIAYAVPHHVTSGKQAKSTVQSSAVKSHAAVKSNTVQPNYAVPTCSNINTIYNSPSFNLHDGTNYYTADVLANIYGTGSLLNGGNNGSGVTVAVFELESYDPGGFNDLKNCYGISTPISQVSVDGGPTAQPNMYTGVGIESALDIENIATMAPGVSIIDYAGPDWNLNSTTDTQVLDTYNRIVTDDSAKVISSSWGQCEAQANPSTISAENSIFSEAAIQGQTVIAASGDSGDTGCYDPTATSPDSELSVDDPASQPFVLGAGGTTMHGLTNNSMVESAWNSVQTDGNGHYYYGATGGGVSTNAAPSFQQYVTAAGYSAHCAAAATSGCRQVPDVAALADPAQGYVIDEYYYDGNPADTGNYYNIIGGTSGAAPVWAAIYALADASAACQAGTPAGQAAPALYKAAKTPDKYSVFRDVTAGNNGISAYNAAYSYPANAGYDMATGWGSPMAPGVVAVACAGSVESAASYYVPNGPTRILDTRYNIGGAGPVAANGGTVKLQITGQNHVPASNVTAVVLNVTATATHATGYAVVYPDGSAMPATSNLNWVGGQVVPNLVTVPVGAGGKVDLVNESGGTVQFIADLAGYFTTDSTSASTYTAVGPVRAMDTRHGIGVPTGKVGSTSTVSLPVGGTTVGSVTIPSGISAVAMNVTVTAPTASGYVTVYPNQDAAGNPVTRPTVSNLNFSANQVIANMVIVPVGKDGKVDFYNGSGGPTDLIADVAGYFTVGTAGAKYHALGPDRLVDTRIGLGTSGPGTLGANGTLGLPLPASATAILANVTVAQATATGYLTAYPAASTRPVVSNLNFTPGVSVPNLAIVPNSGQVDFFNGSGGTVRVIVDLGGYFSAS